MIFFSFNATFNLLKQKKKNIIITLFIFIKALNSHISRLQNMKK